MTTANDIGRYIMQRQAMRSGNGVRKLTPYQLERIAYLNSLLVTFKDNPAACSRIQRVIDDCIRR